MSHPTVNLASAALNDPAQLEALCASSESWFEALRASVQKLESVLVAFSGGVDSMLMLKVAHEVLGERAIALTALSASVSEDEAQEATALAAKLGVQHLVVRSNELADPRYAANPTNRCYFCKTELYTLAEAARVKAGLAWVVDGFNADDKKEYRPGQRAAAERQVKSPLAEAGFTKAHVRAWSKRLGLETWNKPQLACLASRLPYGTQVTVERLNQVGRAEKAIRGLGFSVFRVRYHGEVARVEVSAQELPRLNDPELRLAVDSAVKAAGFTFVAIDLEPFRSGKLNDSLKAGLRVIDATPHS